MCHVSLGKLPLFMAMAMLVFCHQGSLNAAKDEEKDLEEALMMKLLEKRAKSRTDDKAERINKSDLKKYEDDKTEVSVSVVNDIKGMIKEPVLNLLATSELSSWSELTDRVGKAKTAINMFEVKYNKELASGGAVTSAAAVGVAMPGVAVMPSTKPAATMQNAMPAAKPAGMPGIGSMPGLMPTAAQNTMPAAKPAGMPGITSPGMPGVKPAAPAVEEEEEDEEEEDEEAPAVKPGMPAVKPAGMPMAAPAAIPAAKPAGMPGIAPAAALGGMPTAR